MSVAQGRGEVQFRVSPDSLTMDATAGTVSAKRIVASLEAGWNPLDFPHFQMPASPDFWTIPESLLQEAIDACLPCISTEETRYHLNGVCFTTVDGQLVTVATDGHRLARFATGYAWSGPEFILPTEAARFLARHLYSHHKQYVRINHYTGSEKRPALRLEFQTKSFTLRAKTIDGTFPAQWQKLTAKPNPIMFETTFTNADLRGLPKLQNDFMQLVTFDMDKGTYSAKDIGNPHTFTCNLDFARGSGAFGIARNQLEALLINAQRINITGSGPADPFAIHTADQRLLQIIMPAKVKAA